MKKKTIIFFYVDLMGRPIKIAGGVLLAEEDHSIHLFSFVCARKNCRGGQATTNIPKYLS